jgi:hypothetical protein
MMTGFQDWFFGGSERISKRMWGTETPLSTPPARWLGRFSLRHPLPGSFISALVWGVLMFGVFSLLTGFSHESGILIPLLIATAIFWIGTYFGVRWKRRNVPLESSE